MDWHKTDCTLLYVMVIGSVGNITAVAFCIRALFFHQYKMYVIQLNYNMEKEEMTFFFFL